MREEQQVKRENCTENWRKYIKGEEAHTEEGRANTHRGKSTGQRAKMRADKNKRGQRGKKRQDLKG